MKPPFHPTKSIALWMAALVLGLILGRLAHSAITGSPDKDSADSPQVNRSMARKQWDSPLSASSRYLWRETSELRDPETFASGIDRLYRDSRSPLRAVALKSHRVKNSTFEEWEPLLAQGKITRMGVIDEVADHLVRLDAERALNLFFKGPHRFDHLEQFYAFRNSIFDTATELDPELVLKNLKALPRGGAQMDHSRYFTEAWAKRDPSTVAARFDELQAMRNMGLDGATAQIPIDEFAGILMKSWVAKDIEGAKAYVDDLAEGSKRSAMQAAFEKFSKQL